MTSRFIPSNEPHFPVSANQPPSPSPSTPHPLLLRSVVAVSLFLFSAMAGAQQGGVADLTKGETPVGTGKKSDADAKGEHVLFIGNSCTQANNLPEIVRFVAGANGAVLNTDVAPMNGATLDAIRGKPEHQGKILSRRWDAIVLEPYSTGPIFEVHKTIEGAAHVAEMCHTARVYVFATWAYASEERFLQQTDALTKAEEGTIVLDEYKDIYKNMQMLLNVGAAQVATAAKTVKINKRNKQVRTAVVPVGSVWQAALKKHPDWQLHDRDGYHPSKAGSYLSALVFYRVLLGHVPEQAAKEWLDQGWIDQAAHDKMIAVVQGMPDGTFAADGEDAQAKSETTWNE